MEAASFTERFDFRVLDRLDRAAAERALVEPALSVGVTWESAAAASALQAAGGSPYLIQLLGDEAWGLASPDPGGVITQAHAAAATEEVQQSLAAGMFRGRWGKATEAERGLMVAIAQVVGEDGIALTRHITALLGKTTPQLSTARKALIDKGLIESAGTGRLRFTMPGFADFARRHVDAPWYGPRLLQDRCWGPRSPPPLCRLSRSRRDLSRVSCGVETRGDPDLTGPAEAWGCRPVADG